MKKPDFPYDFFARSRVEGLSGNDGVSPEVRAREGLIDRLLALLPEESEARYPVRGALRRADPFPSSALEHFLSYAESRAGEASFRAQLALCCHPSSVVHFLKLMEFCGSDKRLMDRLMALGGHPKGRLILAYVGWLFNGREAILFGKGVDDYRAIFGGQVKGFKSDAPADSILDEMPKAIFDAVMRHEILSYVLGAMDSPVDTRYGTDFVWPSADPALRAVEERFAVPLVVWGGLFREATEASSEFSSADLEALLAETQVLEFDGRPDFDLSTSELFSEADYEKYSTMVRTTITSSLSDVLIQDFLRDLEDPRYHFLLVKREGELIGMIKWTEDGYIGSQYVDEKVAQRFAVGTFLQNRAMASLADGVVPRYTVSIHNTALERQIDRYGVATGVELRPRAQPGGEEFVAEVGASGYRSKDRKVFTREQIQAVAHGASLPEAWGEGISILCMDSSLENNEAYLAEIQRHFDAGEVLTRIFYARNHDVPDPRQTYMVFETKITSASK